MVINQVQRMQVYVDGKSTSLNITVNPSRYFENARDIVIMLGFQILMVETLKNCKNDDIKEFVTNAVVEFGNYDINKIEIK